MFPQYRLTYFEAQLSARHATAEHRQHACPWYTGDDRQLNRPLNVPQYWVACDPDGITLLPESPHLNTYWVPVSPAHQRIVCYIPDAPERGRYDRLSNFIDVLRGIERPRVSII